jgi:hypothetical protein
MNFFKTAALSIALAASFATSAFATVIQTTEPAGSYQHGGQQELGRVTFASGINYVDSLSTSVTLVDQGWGGSDPTNGVAVYLFNGENAVYGMWVAGAGHEWSTQTHTYDSVALTDMNKVLGAIDQSANPLLSMRMITNSWGYPGWALQTQNASMSVTSSEVPEPASVALFGLALAGLTVVRRKSAK